MRVLCKSSRDVALVALILVGASLASGGLSPVKVERGSRPIEYKRVSDWDFDGERILGHIEKDVCLWEASSGKLLRRMKGHQGPIAALRFSPRGDCAVSSSIEYSPDAGVTSETSVRVWDLSSGKEVRRFDKHVFGQFSPDGTCVYARQLPDTAVVYDLRRRALLASSRTSAMTGRPDFNELAASQTSPTLLALSLYGRVTVHDFRSGRLLRSFSDNYREPTGFRLSSQSDRLLQATASSVGESGVAVWSVDQGKLLRRFPFKSDTYAPGDTDFADKGRKIVAVDRDRLGLYDIAEGRQVRSLEVPGRVMRSMVDPTGNYCLVEWQNSNRSLSIVDSEVDGSLIWDLKTGNDDRVLKALPRHAKAIGYSPEGGKLLVGGEMFVTYEVPSARILHKVTLEGLVLPPRGWSPRLPL